MCVAWVLQMLLVPRRRLTIGIMSSDWMFAPLSFVYITLLLQSWTPETLQLIMPGSLQAGLTGDSSVELLPCYSDLVGSRMQEALLRPDLAAACKTHLRL